MAKGHRPRRGSLAFSPRKRAKSHIPRFRSWPESLGESKLQDFAGYKVGMTHVVLIDDVKNSLTEGMEISVPVTIVETPAVRIAAVRAYTSTSYGDKALAEAWASELDESLGKTLKLPKNANTEAALEKLSSIIDEGDVTDIKVISYTLPKNLTGVPKKNSDIMETAVSGSDVRAKFEYAKSILGSEIKINDVFNNGVFVDVAAITTGKGTQGPVKRWGINLMKNKHSRQGSLRQVGTLGPWTPAHVSWRVPQMGQMGYHQRTEYNKRLLKISTDGEDITPTGGFTNYGLVSGDYVLIKGSIPGPSKRLVRLRDPMRSKVSAMGEPQLLHVSTQSNQG
ncbi:50S ribosomal protein L3 [Methanolobus sp. ZRKC3]|uniref:50S ribosomal protein L3 n=1 Tax=Methanolobus sp. ZRKC3 TaxID=3125786 RepID=UPI003251246E